MLPDPEAALSSGRGGPVKRSQRPSAGLGPEKQWRRGARGRLRARKGTVDQSPADRWLVRVGFVSHITCAVIGALALAIAFGAATDRTSPKSERTLSLIARSAIGRMALIVIAAGLLAYALWKLERGVFGPRPEGAGGPRTAESSRERRRRTGLCRVLLGCASRPDREVGNLTA